MANENSQRFFQLRALGLKRVDEEEFSSACFAIGASGVAEDLSFVQKDLCYEPDVVETQHLDLNVYFGHAPNESDLLALQAKFPAADLKISAEENKDWLAEWKKGFVPFLFASPFWVIPSWLKPPPEAPSDKTFHIYIEPGMAFGTGTHETTRLAAALLIRELGSTAHDSLVDVGTGTGILGLIACRLGVGRVVGLDIDPEARRTARENLERNQPHPGFVIADEQIGEVSEKFSLVVANIIDGVLASLRHDLARTLKPDGRMILAGILLEREADFYRDFTADTGLRVIEKIRDGEWSAALLARR